MKNQIRQFLPILEFINKLPPKEKRSYICSAPIPLIKFISDLCFNVLLGNLPLENRLLKKLKPFKKHIENISVKKISLKSRRKILQKKRFFSGVITPLIPILLNLID